MRSFELLAQMPVMRALRPDREYFCSTPHQEDLFAAGMAQQHGAIGEIAECKAFREIGTGQCGLVLSHVLFLWRGRA